jgi:hypothetical protein
MAGNFEIVVEGGASATAKLRGDADRLKEWSRRTVEKAAQEGASVMRFLVPKGTSDMFLGYDTLESRIDSSEAVWHPGGAGGGGTWEAHAGVRRSPRFPNPLEDPATWVYEGTGLAGPKHREITPRAGNLLVFFWEGKWWFTSHVKGQEPQRLWVESAQARANAVVASELATLNIGRLDY